MTEREFIYWLRGYLCHEVITLNEKQVKRIKQNLTNLSSMEDNENRRSSNS